MHGIVAFSLVFSHEQIAICMKADTVPHLTQENESLTSKQDLFYESNILGVTSHEMSCISFRGKENNFFYLLGY